VRMYGDRRIYPYYEDYRPLERRVNNVKIAGWHSESEEGEFIEFSETYNDKVDAMTVYGKCEQAVTVQSDNIIDLTKLQKSAVLALTITEQWQNAVKLQYTGSGAYAYVSYRLPFELIKGKTMYFKSVTSSSNQTKRMALYTLNSSGAPATILVSDSSPPIRFLYTFPEALDTNNGIYGYGLLFYLRFQETISADITYSEIIMSDADVPYEPFVPDSPSVDYPSTPQSSGSCHLVSRNADNSKSGQIILPVLRGVKLPAEATNQTYIDGTGVKWYADTLTYLGNADWSFQRRIDPAIDDCTTQDIDEVYADYILSPLPDAETLHLGKLPTFPHSTVLVQSGSAVKAWIIAAAKIMDN